MAVTQSRAVGIPTIDVAMVTIQTGDASTGKELMLDTAVQIQVATQTETTDPNKLIIKGILRSQKAGTTTVTGTTITLTDNVFTPELVKILQGGTITTDSTSQEITGYTPPVIGSSEKGEIFTLNVYTAVYTPAGTISKYEKTSYPNCQGIPVDMETQDDTFRVNEYTINSYPDTGQAPYTITWVKTLPAWPDAASQQMMTNYSMPNETASGENTYTQPEVDAQLTGIEEKMDTNMLESSDKLGLTTSDKSMISSHS